MSLAEEGVPRYAPLAPGDARRAAPAPRVAVCVSTFRRPMGLRRLLHSLAAQQLDDGEADVFVVVVDNDASASARVVVEGTRMDVPLLYGVEPERNISLARNRSVAMALERGAEWIAFVDDDEVVRPDWLRELLRARAAQDADVVAGALEAGYPDGMPAWLAQGAFYGALVRPTGEQMSVANTGNVLVAASLLREPGGPFDPRFGRTGGGDSHLFMRLHRAGARIVYSGEAVAQEIIPPSRARASWVLRRAFRVGNTGMLCERAIPAGRPAVRLAKATLRLGYGAGSLPLGVVRGRGPLMRALWNVAYGVGAFAGLLGIRYHEYDRPQGE